MRTTFSDPAYSNTDCGTHLSKSEADDLDKRAKLRPRLQEAIDFAERQPDSAGVYIDQRAGGVPVFQFTSGLSGHREGVEARLPVGAEYRLRQVDFTTAELQDTRGAVAKDMDDLMAAGPACGVLGRRRSS